MFFMVKNLNYFNRGGTVVYETKDSTCEGGSKLISMIAEIVKELLPKITKELPFLTYVYKNIPLKYKSFFPFCTVVINWDSPSKVHKDGHDLIDGMCLVVPFGNSSANLTFPNQNCSYILKKGKTFFCTLLIFR
jgi:hypothetical protein